MAITDFDKCVLLLPMKGANNGTTFTNYAPKQAAVTVTGNIQLLRQLRRV